MKIAVYAIALNEEAHAQRFCDAAKDADLIFVADTGSTDGTVEALQANGATVSHIHISPWRFDDARNAALAMLPKDVDVCVSLDLDEILQPGWREEIERVWESGKTTRLHYMFDWGGGTSAGGGGICFHYEKIHSRFGHRWKNACHEHPVADRIEEVHAWTDFLLAVHKPDSGKSRGQYLPLLEVAAKEDQNDPRTAFYYARELSFHQRWHDAIFECRRYLALPNANWNTERCYAMRVIGRCYAELGDNRQAMEWFEKACKEAPETREPWCDKAALAYRLEDWEVSYGAAVGALGVTDKKPVYTIDPSCWAWQPHDWASIAAYRLGLYDEAIMHAENALSFEPENERLQSNLEFCRNAQKSAENEGILAR